MNLIYNLLIGLTDLTKMNFDVLKSNTDENIYYSEIDLNNELEIK